MTLSNKAILEISDLSFRAETLAKGSASQRAQATVLLGRIANIRSIGLSSDEMRVQYAGALGEELGLHKNAAEHRARFDKYLAGKLSEVEMRDFEAGTQSLTATQGAGGGFLVPFAYDSVVREANAQVDPVLNPTIVDFSMTSGPFLQPEQVSGFDLSRISAAVVGESAQQTAQVIPTVLGATLRSDITFRASFGASIEAETDIPAFGEKIVRAASVALARKIGYSVLVGRGGGDISGITQNLSSSLSNTTGGKLVLADLNNIYFSLGKFYRAAPKCGWLFSDMAYKQLRNAVDTSGRPLIDVENDREMLLGKPVFNCPSLAATYSSLGVVGAILFGDLSHIVVRASRPTLQRTVQQTVTDITRGECLYIARCRADATLFDPSSGGTPPVVLATIN